MSNLQLWKCDDCHSMDYCIVLCICPPEGGKDLKNECDLVHYYQQVMKIREDNGKLNS